MRQGEGKDLLQEPGADGSVDRIERRGRDADQHLPGRRAGPVDIVVAQDLRAAVGGNALPSSRTSWSVSGARCVIVCSEFEAHEHYTTFRIRSKYTRGMRPAGASILSSWPLTSRSWRSAACSNTPSSGTCASTAGSATCSSRSCAAHRSPTGEQRMTDLADGVVYSRSGLTYQVDQLEKAGLIRARHRSKTSAARRVDHRGRTRAGPAPPAGPRQLVRRMLLEHLNRRDIAVLTDQVQRVRDRLRRPRPAPRRPGLGEPEVLVRRSGASTKAIHNLPRGALQYPFSTRLEPDRRALTA